MTSVSLAKLRKWILLLLLLIVTILLFAWLRRPKGTWVEIMVNGPWDYLPYQNDASGHQQIVLIVPEIDGHDVPVYFSGPNADEAPGITTETEITYSALHTLLIDWVKGPPDCPSHPVSASHPYFYPKQLLQSQIDTAVAGTVQGPSGTPLHRFAIILPKPCYTSYVQDDHSKVDMKQIDQQSDGLYTTWMSLHYYVDSVMTKATIDGQPAVFSSAAGSDPALSFVDRADKACTPHNLDCDDKSLMSVAASAQLFGLTGKLYAQFPMLNANGTQTTTYCQDQDCKLSNSGMMLQSRMQMGAQPTSDGVLTTAGSGDCHKGQIAFNSALP